MKAKKSKRVRHEDARTHGNVPFIFFEISFFAVAFFYLWQWVNPVLIFYYQEPIFFTDSDFFRATVSMPGGLIAYLASFLKQFFIFGWIGALIITGCIYIVILLIRKCLNRITGVNPHPAYSLIPAIPLLVLHSRYAFTLDTTLSFLAALVFFYGYIRFPLKKDLVKILCFVALSIVLYALASGAMTLFAILCAAFEATRPDGGWKRRLRYGLLYSLWGIAIPYLSVSYLVLALFRDTFNPVFPFTLHEENGIALLLLYLFLPVATMLIFAFRSVNISKRDGRLSKTWIRTVQGVRGWKAFLILSIFLFSMTAGFLFFSNNQDQKALLLVDYYARRAMWYKLIDVVKQHPVNNELMTFHLNRALYHTGRLCEDLFSYYQGFGPDGLFMSDEFALKMRLQKSDLYFDMGHVNAALRWAHEVMSMRGETPWTLQRIAQAAILNGQKEYARICLARLERTLFYRDWARSYRKYLQDTASIFDDPILSQKIALMPKQDFFITYNTADLRMLLKENPQNRMAFEYLMANYLLTKQLGDFIANLHYIKNLRYQHLPRHFEEAVIFYQAKSNKVPAGLAGYPIRSATMSQYQDFVRILQKYGNTQKAKQELWKSYGNTYWYYVMFSTTPQQKTK